MLSKCANPACEAKLHYLREGKIFRISTDMLNHPSRKAENASADGRKPPLSAQHVRYLHVVSDGDGIFRPEYFWLCTDCSGEMTLAVHQGAVVLVPVGKKLALHAAAS